MSYSDSLYAFVMKGMLTKNTLKQSAIRNSVVDVEFDREKLAKSLCFDELDADLLAMSKKMAYVYIAISTFENTVREFVKKKLLEEIGSDWWNKAVPEKIRKRANVRRDEEAKIRWHTPRGETDIQFVDFGDLIAIMGGDNWIHFEPHLLSIEWAKNIIKTLERSRNVIMHSGQLHNEDIERIGTLIRDWTRQVG